MSEQEFTEVLANALGFFSQLEEDESGYDDVLFDSRVLTYEETGLLTSNKGLVIRLADGSEFQLTVVRSR